MQINPTINQINRESFQHNREPQDFRPDVHIHPPPVDCYTEEFKRKNNLTLTNFVKEIDLYNFDSFPEAKIIKKDAQELLTVFNDYQKAWTDLQLEKAKLKTGETTPAKIAKKEKSFKYLGKRQLDLFYSFTTKILRWYYNSYKGPKFSYRGDNERYFIGLFSCATKDDIKANKLSFVASQQFSYFLYE